MSRTSEREQPTADGPSRAVLCAAAIALALVVAAAVAPFQTRAPLADGTFYVATLHSLVADGDVDLTDEAEHWVWLRYYSRDVAPPPGGLRNPFPIGPPLLWSPFYLAWDVASRALGGEGAGPDTPPRPGPAHFGTTFWVAIGLCLVAATLRRLGASRAEAAGVALAVFATSPLPAYLTYAPDMSHGCAFASVALFVWACVALRQDATPGSARWGLAGLALGLVFLTRWQDALFGILPLVMLAGWRTPDGAPSPLAERARGAAWLAAGAALGALPQLVYWKALFGVWLLMPGAPEHLGQGAGFLSLANAEPAAFFFSTWNGAFLCHPALLLGLAGFALRGRAPWTAAAGLQLGAALAIALQISSSLVVADWWAGGSFGQRRFVSTLPLLALGGFAVWRAASASRGVARRALATAVAVLALWNGLSLYRLHEGSLPYNPEHAAWYPEQRVYGHWEIDRRLRDTLLGAKR